MKLKVEYSQEEVARWVVDNLAKHGVQAASGADIWVKWDVDGRLVSMEVAVEPLPLVIQQPVVTTTPSAQLPAPVPSEAAKPAPVKKPTKRVAELTPEELEKKRATWRETARRKNAKKKEAALATETAEPKEKEIEMKPEVVATTSDIFRATSSASAA